MAAKSPTTSVKLREVIGVDQFSQRREVFDQHDTVFLPLPSPTTLAAACKEVDPIITSNHGKTTANFKRNAPAYSSMRESRTEDRNIEFRSRKYSDNFASEMKHNDDDVDYRRSMSERTRRLSKLRRDFLNSNLHDSNTENQFARTGIRASLPVSNTKSPIRYKIESPNLYKFPFAEPYATPPPVRRVVVDLGSSKLNGEKENQDPEIKHSRHRSEPSPKFDHKKLYEDLVKRYSPQRKPVDLTLPPTRPKVVGSVPKSTSSVTEGVDSVDKISTGENFNIPEDDNVFTRNEPSNSDAQNDPKVKSDSSQQNGPENIKEKERQLDKSNKGNDSKLSLTELEEKNDQVPELSPPVQRHSKDTNRPSVEKYTDLTIPALIDKITEDGEDLEKHKNQLKKVKRKRSFLDKLFGRKKEK